MSIFHQRPCNLPGFLYQLPKNIIRCFMGYNLLWHFLAIVLTVIIVTSDFDWTYFLACQKSFMRTLSFPAVRLGMILPVFVPLILLAFGALRKDFRINPPHFLGPGTLVDTSHGFRFGFLRGGMFWGWPSSHTTVAFAMAVVLWKLYPENKLVRYAAMFYAFYVGIGVSFRIHWFSEFVAGAIIGSVIGAVVGKSFKHRRPSVEQ
ncbi:MAG: phosphatase PAP2 family protein [Desulfobacterales bacterium]